MEYFLHRLNNGVQQILKSLDFTDLAANARRRIFEFLRTISSIGLSHSLGDYEKRKLSIFNQLNFFQLITGVIVPVISFFTTRTFPVNSLVVSLLPASISAVVLLLNFFRQYYAALLCYFILYPVFTCVIYINGYNLGIELSFVLYGILSVFFLQDIGYMLFAVSLSMVSYFILSITWKDYRYQLEAVNYQGYLVNHALSILYIFYGLYLIKRENTDYQFGIATQNAELSKKNTEIEIQKKEILFKARLLESQTAELNELNHVKDKLFSIISHDLKSPMYALQNVFMNARKFDLPAEEIKEMLPEVVNDLNYTTALIENLLHWAKTQMQSSSIEPEKINLTQLASDTIRQLHLQAEEKSQTVELVSNEPVYAWADGNMISLVIRNLVSNAIKFSPSGGHIVVGTVASGNTSGLFVQDSGTGIDAMTFEKIQSNQVYSTRGTQNEKGTGLGLTLCKEFLGRNGGTLTIESSQRKGSKFSFRLPATSNRNLAHKEYAAANNY